MAIEEAVQRARGEERADMERAREAAEEEALTVRRRHYPDPNPNT